MKHIINNIIRFSWLFGFLFIPNMSFSDTKTFSFTGGVQTWIVPKGNKTITIEGYGAGGGYGENNGNNIEVFRIDLKIIQLNIGKNDA